MPFAHHSIAKTSRAASTFLLCAAWLVLSLAAAGEISRLAPPAYVDLVRQASAACLLFAGFYMMASMFLTDLRPLSNVGFVLRPGVGGEFARGAALGWGIAIALTLPALLSGNMALNVSFTTASLVATGTGILTLLAFGLVLQLILAGLPVRTLLKSTTGGWTVAAVLLVLFLVAAAGSANQGRGFLFMALAGFLFVAAFLRTRAIWVPLGIQVGWTLSQSILFGLPSPYAPSSSGVIVANLTGATWLTGSPFGPEASALALVVLIAAIAVLYRLTKDYAWHYTWQPVEGAGHPMDVPPPAQHAREEAKQAAPLIQIGGISPAPPPADRHE